MNWTPGATLRAGATLGAALVFVATSAGCGVDGEPEGVGRTSAPVASPSATAVPTEKPPSAKPSATLSAAEQEAFEQATAAVMAYRQTITDLYSGARTNLNDLNLVATGDLLSRNLTTISKDLRAGYRTEPTGFQLLLVEASPKSLSLRDELPEVVVSACIDASGARALDPDGSAIPGVREVLDYTVVQVDYLPSPGWAVARVTSDLKAGERLC